MAELIVNGCELAKPKHEILAGIWNLTGGDPCTGCALQKSCEAIWKIRKAHGGKKRKFTKPVETNAIIAKRLGISTRQVSKMRKRGEI
jgi:hypothetical protein